MLLSALGRHCSLINTWDSAESLLGMFFCLLEFEGPRTELMAFEVMLSFLFRWGYYLFEDFPNDSTKFVTDL